MGCLILAVRVRGHTWAGVASKGAAQTTTTVTLGGDEAIEGSDTAAALAVVSIARFGCAPATLDSETYAPPFDRTVWGATSTPGPARQSSCAVKRKGDVDYYFNVERMEQYQQLLRTVPMGRRRVSILSNVR